MPLNLNTGGDGAPYLKYNAKAGRFSYKAEDGSMIDVQGFNMAVDFAGIRTGWVKFAEGAGPDWAFDPSLQQAAARPSNDHKRGFHFNVMSQAFGGVRELASSAAAICESINEMYAVYEAAPESGQGQVPVFQFTGIQEIKSAKGTNYKPLFQLVAWTPRPADFEEFDKSKSAPATPAASGGIVNQATQPAVQTQAAQQPVTQAATTQTPSTTHAAPDTATGGALF